MEFGVRAMQIELDQLRASVEIILGLCATYLCVCGED